MTDLPTVERLISGKGEIQIPESYKDAREAVLYCEVVRDATNKSLNTTYNPDKSFYAHINFMFGDYVVQTFDLHYDYQCFKVVDNMSAQIMLAIKCLAAEIAPTSAVLGFKYNTYLANKIRFECYSSTAINLVLKGTELEFCDEEDKSPEDPPEPPPKLGKIPPDTTIEVSPPYPDDPDGNNTDPNEGDDIENPPGSQECQQYTVTYSYTAVSDGGAPNRISNQVIHAWGRIGAIVAGRDANSDPQIRLSCQGIVDFEQPCEEVREIGISTLTGGGLAVTFSDPNIDNIT